MATLQKAKEAHVKGQTNEFFKNIITILDSKNHPDKEEAYVLFLKFSYSYKYVEYVTFKYIQYYEQQVQNPKNSFAAYYLGDCYLFGNGVKINNREALQLLNQAIEANKDNHMAIHTLGYLYSTAKEDDIYDARKAISLFEMAIEKGNTKSLYNLGELYLYGYGCEPDIYKGIHLIEKSFECKNPHSYHSYAQIFRTHHKFLDFEKALNYYKLAYTNGFTYALVLMIFVHNKIKKWPHTIETIIELVNNLIDDLVNCTKYHGGDAHLYLGTIYEDGIQYNGVKIIKKDLNKALEYFKQAVEKNSTDTGKYYRVAYIYYKMNDIKNCTTYLMKGIEEYDFYCISFFANNARNFPDIHIDVTELLKKGIKRDNTDSMCSLAFIEYNAGNFGNALSLFKNADAHGSVCTAWLYHMYNAGTGVMKSKEIAMGYLLLGRKMNHAVSMNYLASEYKQTGKQNEAIEICYEIISLCHDDKQSKAAALTLGNIYENQKQMLLAIKYYIKANSKFCTQAILLKKSVMDDIMKQPNRNDLLKALSKMNEEYYNIIVPEWLQKEVSTYVMNNLIINI